MRHLLLSGVGRDRPGIVAGVTGLALEHGLNVEDSRSTILGGHFTMMLMVSGPDGLDLEALREGLEDTGRRLELEATFLHELAGLSAAKSPDPSHVVTVYGADHPGIVHAVSSALAGRGVSITDLATHLVGEGVGRPLYAMMMEVALPPGLDPSELEAVLAALAPEQGVEATVRVLGRDAL
ncbi:MAG: glycine cleavage system protein R [Thermoleophilaceae bacterium]|jgi:glycine cleavage system transcriptional repressor